MRKLYPVILSGGNGTRLWPLSRAAYPKQLLALCGEATMLQATIQRASSASAKGIEVQPPIVVCNEEHRFLVREQCAAIGSTTSCVYLEPAGRNTAPAIALAALHVAQALADPDALLLVLPADQVIEDQRAFANAVQAAIAPAAAGRLVLFGIQPTRPETGFGYVKAGAALAQFPGAHAVEEFVEKPGKAVAEAFVSRGQHTWNSGMFVFTAGKLLAELGQHRPRLLRSVTEAWERRRDDLGFMRPDRAAFEAIAGESIDYAVMQETPDAAVVPVDFKWSDVGSWESLWQVAPRDAQGNALQGDVFISDTRGSYVRAESRLVAVIGLDDVVVVESPDAVLVMRKDKSQDVKLAVEHFQRNGRKEHLEHVRVYRPWGWYEGVDAGERFQVKRIMVRPGDKLSLQMHHHRAEHWIVVSGTAKVTINGVETMLAENQSTYIPVGHTHRLENPGKIPLHLVEVQSGSYLGEDDIVRFEDGYGRAGS